MRSVPSAYTTLPSATTAEHDGIRPRFQILDSRFQISSSPNTSTRRPSSPARMKAALVQHCCQASRLRREGCSAAGCPSSTRPVGQKPCDAAAETQRRQRAVDIDDLELARPCRRASTPRHPRNTAATRIRPSAPAAQSRHCPSASSPRSSAARLRAAEFAGAHRFERTPAPGRSPLRGRKSLRAIRPRRR